MRGARLAGCADILAEGGGGDGRGDIPVWQPRNRSQGECSGNGLSAVAILISASFEFCIFSDNLVFYLFICRAETHTLDGLDVRLFWWWCCVFCVKYKWFGLSNIASLIVGRNGNKVSIISDWLQHVGVNPDHRVCVQLPLHHLPVPRLKRPGRGRVQHQPDHQVHPRAPRQPRGQHEGLQDCPAQGEWWPGYWE